MPKPKRMTAAIVAMATVLMLGATAWRGAFAQEVAPDADACLARATVTCSVELALAASADSHEDHERAELVVRTAYRLQDLDARKAYLDRAAARFFTDSSPADFYLDRQRRIVDIVAAVMDGDGTTADRRLSEANGNFQLWWLTFADVLDVLASAGRPDLAVAFEARHHFTETIGVQDGLGRDLGERVFDTQQLLADSLVDCDCGPDPLPMVLGSPSQTFRLDSALVLYARRNDVDGMMSFLKREFGDLAKIEDETQREWVGYAFGLMANTLPLPDVPSVLSMAPDWLTAWQVRRPDGGNKYGAALARAIDAGDRAAVAALIKLRKRDDIRWFSAAAITDPDVAANVEDLLPKLEREHLLLLRTKSLIERGDGRKALDEVMNASVADAWRGPELTPDDGAAFDVFVMEPLLARGDFDVAEEAARYLGDDNARKGTLEMIASKREVEAAGVEPKDAAAMLAEHWDAYRQPDAGVRDPGRAFLFAIRDLLRSQPDAFPFK